MQDGQQGRAIDYSSRGKRIALVVAHLGPGGAQRVITTAANELAKKGLDVHVITILEGPGDAYDLDFGVRRHRCRAAPKSNEHAANRTPPLVSDCNVSSWRPAVVLNGFHVFRRVFVAIAFGSALQGRARWLRRTLKQIEPDAVLSFLTQTNILTIVATRGLGIRTVVSERNDPRLQKHRRRVELMRRAAYRFADCVTANSYGAVGALAEFVAEDKLAFLPNPLSMQQSGPKNDFRAPIFITVTRLVEQKGLDVLLRACAKVFRVLPFWRLAIVGDGPLRQQLESLADQLGIADRVEWVGHVRDPAPYLRAAEFFVLTSRFEGSPNALLEAMALGLPAVISDASPGPIELIGGGAAGLVVPVEDVDATSAAILRLAQDAELRGCLGEAAKAMTRGHQLDTAMQTWLKILKCC